MKVSFFLSRPSSLIFSLHHREKQAQGPEETTIKLFLLFSQFFQLLFLFRLLLFLQRWPEEAGEAQGQEEEEKKEKEKEAEEERQGEDEGAAARGSAGTFAGPVAQISRGGRGWPRYSAAAGAGWEGSPPCGPAITSVPSPLQVLTDEQKSRIQAMKPMTKEEWDARQSVIRKVVDPETGRTRWAVLGAAQPRTCSLGRRGSGC